MTPQEPSCKIFVEKMVQWCGIWQIKPMFSLDQDSLSLKSSIWENLLGVLKPYIGLDFWETAERLLRDYWETTERLLRDWLETEWRLSEEFYKVTDTHTQTGLLPELLAELKSITWNRNMKNWKIYEGTRKLYLCFMFQLNPTFYPITLIILIILCHHKCAYSLNH